MRGLIIMLIIFSILLSFVIFEEIYVRKTTEKLSNALCYETTSENISAFFDDWKDKKKILDFFVNQKELENITIELITAKIYIEKGDNKNYEVYKQRANERIMKLPEY